MKYLVFVLLISTYTCFGQEEIPLPPPVPDCIERSEQEVPDYVNIQPEFPGGKEKMMLFISNHFNYPSIDMDNGIQGTVYLSFVIEVDGSITGIKILKGVSKALDAEAVRIVKLMPKWKAGEQVKGKPIRSRYIIPVKARLS